ncbi:2-dehydropantoate 2-reductase [uncultured Cohaesibacter sp.]|uniref:2-dehydropantoate 2-reductase n=1 Tax=uncultured Cohaesibacter sp. TaxID=1002546 RepID=UPI002D1E427A|nr:2-dehydropantoate 2-reductase [uncultured Cohaesibacter sp.]
MEKNAPTVAVIGAGAIGLALATALAKAGHEVVLCDDRRAIGTIEKTVCAPDNAPETLEHWDLRTVSNPDEIRSCKIGILAVKAHQTDNVAPWLQALNRGDASILVAQNGIEHVERTGRHAPNAKIVPSIIFLNVERMSPEKIKMRVIGKQDVTLPDTETGRTLAEDLRKGGLRVALSSDFMTMIWKKFLINIVGNPLTALTGRRADVIREPDIAELAHSLLVEAIAVGRAEGADLPEEGYADFVIKWLQALPDGSTTSMLQDRLNGRQMEYDAMTGAIVRNAERHGVHVPYNRMILALLTNIKPERA